MLHYRSVTESSASGHDIKHYSGDQFESSSEHIAMQPTSDKLHSAAGASQKADQNARLQQNEDHSQYIDDEPILSHSRSGNTTTSCFICQ